MAYLRFSVCLQLLPVGSTADCGGEGKQRFRAEISGLIPPWGLDLLSKALCENGATDCQVETGSYLSALFFGKMQASSDLSKHLDYLYFFWLYYN